MFIIIIIIALVINIYILIRGTFLGIFIKIIIVDIPRAAIINIFFAFTGGYNKYNY